MNKSAFFSSLSRSLDSISETDENHIKGKKMSERESHFKAESEHGAPGPEDDELVEDELVGVEIRGIRLTAKGLHDTNDGFWYFPKFLRNEDGEPKGEDGVYWYKKKRSESSDGDSGGKMIEEYIGKSHDDLPFKVPAEFLGHIKRLEEVLKSKGDKPKDDEEEKSSDSE